MKKSIGLRTTIYPSPALVIGSYDKAGKPNMMTAAWGGICCSRPPCVTVSLQKVRYSYDSIEERKAFTVNVPSENQVKEVDYFGIASGRDFDKLSITSMIAVGSDIVDAPYGDDFPMVLECKLIKVVEIGSHTQFIGEILDVKVDENVLTPEGVPNIETVKPIIYAHLERKYYGIGKCLGAAFSCGKEFKKS